MIENWKKQLGNGKKVVVIFMDLSKAFNANLSKASSGFKVQF